MPWNARLMRRAADMADEGEAPAMERMLRAKALYYASISYIDHQVGRIKDEKHLDVADLDLEHWERKRGKGCIAELEQLMGRKLR